MKANTWKDDAEKVKNCMSLTADYRMLWIKEGTEKTLADILEEYPRLLDPGMVSIILLVFIIFPISKKCICLWYLKYMPVAGQHEAGLQNGFGKLFTLSTVLVIIGCLHA